MIDARVAYFTNRIPPHRLSFLKLVSGEVRDLQIYISIPTKSHSPPSPGWEGLNVQVQKTLTLNRIWKHPSGFNDPIYVHIPCDTIPILQKVKPDVIISGELGFNSLQSAFYATLHPACRLILWCNLSEHTEQGRGIIRALLRRWLLPHANAILVNGESGARYIKQFGISDSRIFHIGYTPPIEKFIGTPLEQLGKKVDRVVMAGRLIERKGILPFLHCLNHWLERHPEKMLEITFAGDGPLRYQLENESLLPNLNLRFLGDRKYEDMPKIYADADILAFPTLADEWGLVVNEALAVGLPVLGSLYSQAVEELVIDRETGWTFHPDKLEEMAQAIDDALSVEPKQLAEMRLAARKTALMNSPSIIADKLLQAIGFVLK